jgi:hypothetical protein
MRRIIALFFAGSLITGCSGLKPYPNDLEKNIFVSTKTDSGSILSDIEASVDIFDVDKNCKLIYKGTVDLEKPITEIGLATGRASYLGFIFKTTGFLAPSTSSMSYYTLLKPRKKYRYNINVSYEDNIYDVEIRETQSRKQKGKEIKRTDLSNCRSL